MSFSDRFFSFVTYGKTLQREKIILIAIVLVVAGYVIYRQLFGDARKKAILDSVLDQWGKHIDDASRLYGIPRKRIASIISQESQGDPDATGGIGEMGLMQLTPGAYAEFKKRYAKDFSFGVGFGKSPLYEPRTNIFVGTGYLRILFDKYGSLDDATKAYNSGTDFNDEAGLKYLAYVKSYERQYYL